MTCTRCGGLMTQDSFLDMLDTDIGFNAWRCISCGDIVDSVVLANRQRQLAKPVTQEVAEVLFDKTHEPAKAA